MRGAKGLLVVAVVGLLAAPAMAELQLVQFADTTSQDVIPAGPYWVDELGWKPPFPDMEWIISDYVETTYRPCPQNLDNPNIPNMEVTITNRADASIPPDGIPDRSFYPLYYVADPETSLTNDDGFINGQLAFRIDAVGVNTPLVFESMGWNGIFEPGETWRFVIQDYTNTFGLAPHLFGSIGVGNLSGGDTFSSGSIIPEPASLLLLAVAVGMVLRCR